jgi:hypothetical protein
MNGMTALTSLSFLEAHVSFQRYKNEDLIWGGPKGINYGGEDHDYLDFVGAGPDDDGNLFPSHNTYFDASIWLPPDTSLTLTGEFPHSRYFSFTVAEELEGGGLGNGQYLNGREIKPNPGSKNPYDPKNTRDVIDRDYAVHIVQEDPPEHHLRKDNTIYIGAPKGKEGRRIALRLRTYVPDIHYDATGVQKLGLEEFLRDLANGVIKQGTGLPVATLNGPKGKTETGPSLVKTLRARKDGDPPGYSRKKWLGEVKDSDDPINAPCKRKPKMQRFFNTGYNVDESFTENPEKAVRDCPATDDGGFSNNPNTGYMYTPFSFDYGEVLVIRGKMPTHPHTRRGEKYLPKNPQVQYFSVSTSDGPSSGEGDREVFDEAIPVDEDGYWTAVACWPDNRPSNARLSDKVIYLNPGNGEGRYVGSRIWVGNVYARFEDPAEDWEESPLNIPPPTPEEPIPQGKRIMKEYYPEAWYTSKEEFEQWWAGMRAEREGKSSIGA